MRISSCVHSTAWTRTLDARRGRTPRLLVAAAPALGVDAGMIEAFGRETGPRKRSPPPPGPTRRVARMVRRAGEPRPVRRGRRRPLPPDRARPPVPCGRAGFHGRHGELQAVRAARVGRGRSTRCAPAKPRSPSTSRRGSGSGWRRTPAVAKFNDDMRRRTTTAPDHRDAALRLARDRQRRRRRRGQRPADGDAHCATAAGSGGRVRPAPRGGRGREAAHG